MHVCMYACILEPTNQDKKERERARELRDEYTKTNKSNAFLFIVHYGNSFIWNIKYVLKTNMQTYTHKHSETKRTRTDTKQIYRIQINRKQI